MEMLINTIPTWRAATCAALISCFMSGCGGGAGQASTAPATANTQQSTAPSSNLSLSGNPAATVMVGAKYSFAPTTAAPTESKLTYSAQNVPAWASLDTNSGVLSGTPYPTDVGQYSNIVISVTDGTASASLAAFSINVTEVSNGSATVSWNTPATNSDGTALTNLAGFHIYYGTGPDSLTQMAQVANAGITTYVIANLTAATWYFGVKAYNSSGTESSISNVGSKTIN
jgi:hypothetical protein